MRPCARHWSMEPRTASPEVGPGIKNRDDGLLNWD